MSEENPRTARTVACLNVFVGPPNRDGRTTTRTALKAGVERVFWKRGRWHVRLERWVPSVMVVVELHHDEKDETVTRLLSDELRGLELVRVPRFQPVVGLYESAREVTVTVWENFGVDADDVTRATRPATKVRVGFSLVVLTPPADPREDARGA